VTRGGGLAALESTDGQQLYYAKGNDRTSVRTVPVSGGDEVQVFDSLSIWANFDVMREGIYYFPLAVAPRQYRLQFYRFADGKKETVAPFEIERSFGISVSPDRRTILFAPWESKGSDLMLIENFR